MEDAGAEIYVTGEFEIGSTISRFFDVISKSRIDVHNRYKTR